MRSGWIVAALVALNTCAFAQKNAEQRFGSLLRQTLGKGIPGVVPKNVIFLNQVVLKLQHGTDVTDLCKRLKMTHRRTFFSDPDTIVCTPNAPQKFAPFVKALRAEAAILSVWQDFNVVGEKCSFTPNDPFAGARNLTPVMPTANEQYYGQYHLEAANLAFLHEYDGLTTDLTPAGMGIPSSLAFIDDGFDYSHHEDLDNYDRDGDRDFTDGDDDAYIGTALDVHGTSVMGIAGALGGNAVAMCGIAPRAVLTGLRHDFRTGLTSAYVDAIRYQNPNYPIKVKNHGGVGLAPFSLSTPAVGALEASTDLGMIHVFPAGNSTGTTPYATSLNALLSSPTAIVVSAYQQDENDAISPWTPSGFGSNVLCTAITRRSFGYNEDDGSTTINERGISTLNCVETPGYPSRSPSLPREYTDSFEGTSASGAIVTGILGLLLEAKPDLSLRFAKHLIARTAFQVDEMHPNWVMNAAGRHFNPHYGFGSLDAMDLITESYRYSGVTPLVTREARDAGSWPIPSGGMVEIPLDIAETAPLEEVVVQTDIEHTSPSRLVITLISPAGTQSTLLSDAPSTLTSAFTWPFLTNAFWGENGAGRWRLRVQDLGGSGLANRVRFVRMLTRHGQLVARTPVDRAECVLFNVSRDPMFAGRPYEVTVQYRNTGTFDWTGATHNLISDGPRRNARWGARDAFVPGAFTAPPGASFLFRFPVTAPSVEGEALMQWRMANGTDALNNPSPTRRFEIQIGDDATVTPLTISPNQYSGAPFNISVRVQNLGTTTWTRAAGYGLLSWDPEANTSWGVSFVPLAVGESIAPGQIKTFTFPVTAPIPFGPAPIAWRMTRAPGGIPFGDPCPTVQVTVTPDRGELVSFEQDAEFSAGAEFNATFTFRNTGTSTWRGATHTFACISVEAAATWGGLFAQPMPRDVAPGDEISFSCRIRSTSVTGRYDFSFGVYRSSTRHVFAAHHQEVDL